MPDTTDRTTALHEAGHALVAYAVYGGDAIALIRLRGTYRRIDIPAERRNVKRRLISGVAQEASPLTSTDEIAAFGSVSFAGLAAEKILLAPPLDWYHGTMDCRNLVSAINQNGLPYRTFDPSNLVDLRNHAQVVEPYRSWFTEAQQFLSNNKSALSQFFGFLKSYRDSRVPGEVANAEIKKALRW